jgi:hypothetical protein
MHYSRLVSRPDEVPSDFMVLRAIDFIFDAFQTISHHVLGNLPVLDRFFGFRVHDPLPG